MLEWYLNAVQKGGIFVWANGNMGRENGKKWKNPSTSRSTFSISRSRSNVVGYFCR
ncbi:hypothetical protein [Fusobacterium necrophorum]|uniref:hypothetical protein n=1 Tax=Fusobacterium necrophorum TaxID=859 RepID=UPI003D6EC149